MKADMRDFAIRDLGCTCCYLMGYGGVPCEKHHLNAQDRHGGKRRGEAYTVGLCKWHHVGRCHCDGSQRDCPTCHMRYGPSWHHSAHEFRDTFGSGDDLLAVQNERIEKWRKNTLGAAA
jgi:hypothetical protein